MHYKLVNFLVPFLAATPPILQKGIIRLLPPYYSQQLLYGLDPNMLRKRKRYQRNPRKRTMVGDGYSLVVDINDHVGFYTWMKDRPFEIGLYRLGQLMNVQEDDIILDIGANIGTASIPLCVERKCQLVAVEASKEIAGLLLENILINRVKAQVHLFALADSKQAGYLGLYKNYGNFASASIFAEWNPSIAQAPQFEEAPVTTLDQLAQFVDFDYTRLKLVKIDVEGAEALILQGAHNFLRSNQAPLMIEYRLDAVKKYLGSNMDQLLNTLEAHSYNIYSFVSGKVSIFDKEKSYENIIALKKGSHAHSLILSTATPPVDVGAK